jgi:hypothetical protein
MTYFIRNMDLGGVIAIICLAAFGMMGWMEMHDGGSVVNSVSPVIADGIMSVLQFLISMISAI